MKLQVVGSVNKLSKEMYATVKELKKGQKAVFRLLGGTIEPTTKEKFFGGIKTINCVDKIKDIGTGEIVDIGIPERIEEGEVTKFKKFVLNGGGPNGLVGEYFELHGGNIGDEILFTFLSLCNSNNSNENRDPSVLAQFEQVDEVAESKRGFRKRSSLLKALGKHENMSQVDIVRFAAGMNWDETKDPDLLYEEVGAYAMKFPDEFLKKIDGGLESIKADLKLATTKGVIGFDQIRFCYVWGESGAVIAKLEKDGDKDELTLFAEWIQHAKNGNTVLEAIKSAFDNTVSVQRTGEPPVEKKPGKGKKAAETNKPAVVTEPTPVVEENENKQPGADVTAPGEDFQL